MRVIEKISVLFVFLVCFSFLREADAGIDIAEELIISLDAGSATAGEDIWENDAPGFEDYTFQKVGEPTVIDINGAKAVSFNSTDTQDAYVCTQPAPLGLVEPDSTRSIEVWAYNESIPGEETILSWGSRGGPDGTNMSFNWGSDPNFGAVGQWGNPDLGWGDNLPATGQWHYLAYTYDGSTTTVYCDGEVCNTELLGPGMIDTNDGFPITIASQTEADGTLNYALRGVLSIGRIRIHDGVLTPDQIINNYDLERPDFPIPNEVSFVNAPEEDSFIKKTGEDVTYSLRLEVKGYPDPISLEALEPAGATVVLESKNIFNLTYQIPAGTDSFTVHLKATNGNNDTAEATWTVTGKNQVDFGDLEIAGELYVYLDAADDSAGTDNWLNYGSLGNFMKVGDPFVETIGDADAVTFNSLGATDAYQCVENAPDGLVGMDATASIEVWAYNPVTEKGEETLVAWGQRGGPDGSNMSFGYGTDLNFGAVGHWGTPDLGWDNAGGAPAAAEWHYLVYTYDGTTTRVYADGLLANSEVLGSGVINTHAGTPITIATQIMPDGVTLDFNPGLVGTLSIGKVRVHDGVLTPAQIQNNFAVESGEYGVPDQEPLITVYPINGDSFIAGSQTYTASISYTGIPVPTIEVQEPTQGATVSLEGVFTYTIPDPPPESFTVTLRAFNDAGEDIVSWDVTRIDGESLQFGPLHRYSFTDDASDSIGDADGVVVGDTAVFADGMLVLNNDGTQVSADPSLGSYVDLPNGMISSIGNEATFESWITWNGGPPWQRIFDFGTSEGGEDVSSGTSGAVNYIFLTPSSGETTLRFGYNNGAAGAVQNERNINSNPLPGDGTEHHVVITWDESLTTTRMYLDGKLVDEDLMTHLLLSDLDDVNNWLGRSQWGADALLNGSLDEFRIYDYALSYGEVIGNYQHGPDVVNTGGAGGIYVFSGDTNADGAVNLADAITLLSYLFAGDSPPSCMKSGDLNNDGTINLADAITLLSYQFSGGSITAPDGGFITSGSVGCTEYPEDKVSDLGCLQPCQ